MKTLTGSDEWDEGCLQMNLDLARVEALSKDLQARAAYLLSHPTSSSAQATGMMRLNAGAMTLANITSRLTTILTDVSRREREVVESQLTPSSPSGEATGTESSSTRLTT